MNLTTNFPLTTHEFITLSLPYEEANIETQELGEEPTFAGFKTGIAFAILIPMLLEALYFVIMIKKRKMYCQPAMSLFALFFPPLLLI